MAKTAIPELLGSIFLIFQEGINPADMVKVWMSGTHKLKFGSAWPYVSLTRMSVPKMVKNGFNSVLQTSAGSRRLVATRNSGTMRSPKLSPKSQKANKNHFRPIQEHACALHKT